ncbi:kinesin family protein [Arthroderma uncinatum]|uniref:kinesin family protein n=1 Tax=Arthroderma uncinatum TaxID=74035 RepID=UPI00144AF53F|nr:kinesin family protein [Arthroderma uncinatum]KAF3490827.1 kinesin family protein [Arthroderma uncinatum]
MAQSPPGSPSHTAFNRPLSLIMRPPRSNSRMSVGSKHCGSGVSDEDGKTAVKVVVRVRPPLQHTDPGFDLIPQRFQRPTVHVTSPTNLAIDAPQGRKLFVFDRVFGESVDQEGIWDYLHDSVNSFIQGYNVSILAYGQSGAGKSYTMGTSGPSEQNDSKAMGIVPRAAQMLFEKLTGAPATHNRTVSGSTVSGLRTPQRYSNSSSLPTFGRGSTEKSWQMRATYVEIYNEQLRDLLLPETTPPNERNTVTIREDTKGRIILTGLHQISINSVEDLINALNFGSAIRQTDSTAINAKSSRSHAVFSINLIQRKDGSAQPLSAQEKRFSMPAESPPGADQVTVDSKLHFVDLAGSERLKNTGASGERAKEGISINAGLASLGKVISQLSSRQQGSHVSYRDSKLTRLLQDSLGGNAITYMIACVTPPEFHLSETLNTVQYAQRARAIQSKPRIQQVSDESDKQAVIERLKAEVAFLRQQIRNSDGGERDRRTTTPQERSERQNEREIELQNHLLDVQESYTALSQRHAKLISELTKASSTEMGDVDDLKHVMGDTSMERLKRSHSFAESVEQVVLEYEKTIQSLESSLSHTRASLSSTESSLLERETKCAYVETVNGQLQARMQKMMDREANTESYLHDLESKLDGHATGEEKNAAIVAELRKELNRARENEASCEDYISTLEERLAEADQDMELMQSEMDRLEHVIDRQRSLGKLDNLLYELDHVQNGTNGTKDGEDTVKKAPTSRPKKTRTRTQSLDVLTEAVETAIPESDDDLVEGSNPSSIQEETALDLARDDAGLAVLERATPTTSTFGREDEEEYTPNAAQSQFVAEKLDTITQELFDLRIQHDHAMNEYSLLNAKYQESLRAMAELQDSIDEPQHSQRPQPAVAFLDTKLAQKGRVKVNGASGGEHQPSSRSLSSELSSAEQGSSLPTSSAVVAKSAQQPASEAESEVVKKLMAEHQEAMAAVTNKYSELQMEHDDSLSLVESLKEEVTKYKNAAASSPPHTPNVIRRMTSQSMMTVDRAHRNLSALRIQAAEEFESRPETLQNFDQKIESALRELNSRMERIQALESENKNVKKEMETKATIISGLTRERSSLQAVSPVDMTVVSQLRDQVVNAENQMAEMKELHEAKERELANEIKSINALVDEQKAELKSMQEEVEKHKAAAEEWQGKHRMAAEELSVVQDRLQASEKQVHTTIAELEASLASVDAMRKERREGGDRSIADTAANADALEKERSQHQELVDSLKREIDGHKATIGAHLAKISTLESDRADSRAILDDKTGTEDELNTHRNRAAELSRDIDVHKSTVEAQRSELETLQVAHKRELMELETKTKAAVEAQYESQLAEKASAHESALEELRAELTKSKDESSQILKTITSLLKTQTPVTTFTLTDQLQDVLSQKDQFADKYSSLMDTNEDLTRQLDEKHGTHSTLEKQVVDLKNKANQHEMKVNELALLVATHEEAIAAKEAMIEEIKAEKEKSVRLVEELEEQITSSFDQHHNRLSVIQAEKSLALEEAKAKIALHDKEIETYRTRIEQLESQTRPISPEGHTIDRSSTMSTNLRKSSSAASLPSPPPAIPLPPLPNIAAAANPASISPPSSRHQSKELANNQFVEDQEARIRTIEKHLHAEKQLTATLEEALGDLEAQSNKVKSDMELWKKKAWQLEEEVTTLRSERNSARLSLQAVEEERSARREAEAARAHLEEKMNAISKKKKKSTLNCF